MQPIQSNCEELENKFESGKRAHRAMFTMKRLLRSMLVRNPNIWAFGLDVRRRLNRLRKHPFDLDFMLLASFHPPEGTVFIDAGANVGEAVEAMRLAHPHVPIAAFEPSAVTCKKLRATVGHLDGVSIIQCALSEEPGNFTLYTPVCNGGPLPALASTLREEAAGWIEKYVGQLAKNARIEIHEETVAVETLDRLGLAPSFLKIDVQGAEARLLRGGMETLKNYSPLIMVEQSPNDGLAEILEPLGYTYYYYDSGRLVRGAQRNANAFYLTDKHRQMIDATIIDQ